jgi:hypothetical protein
VALLKPSTVGLHIDTPQVVRCFLEDQYEALLKPSTVGLHRYTTSAQMFSRVPGQCAALLKPSSRHT